MLDLIKSNDKISFSVCFYLPTPTKELVYLITDIPGDSSQYLESMAMALLEPLLGLLLLTLIITSQEYDLLIQGNKNNVLIISLDTSMTEKEMHILAKNWVEKKSKRSLKICHIDWVIFTNLIKSVFPRREDCLPETIQ
jgi:hypothetical protein